MPWMVCPCCALWSLRSTWVGIGPGFPFQIACPACGVASDVAAVLALRVYRAVCAAVLSSCFRPSGGSRRIGIRAT